MKFGPHLPHTSSWVGMQLQNCWGSFYLIWHPFLSSIETFTSMTPLGFAIISTLYQYGLQKRSLNEPERQLGVLLVQVLLLESVKTLNPKYKLSPFKKYNIINLLKKLICEKHQLILILCGWVHACVSICPFLHNFSWNNFPRLWIRLP